MDTTELVERLREYVDAHDEQLLVIRGQHDFIAALNEIARAADTIERLTRERDEAYKALLVYRDDAVERLARATAAEAERDRLREALKGTAASLVAALAILNRAREANVAPNYVVASNKMFAQMLRDYEASLDVARAALKGDTP